MPSTRLGLFQPGMPGWLFRTVYLAACIASRLVVVGWHPRAAAGFMFVVAVSKYRWNVLVAYLDGANKIGLIYNCCRPMNLGVLRVGFRPIDSTLFGISAANPAAAFQCRPELSGIGPLVAPEHRLCILPAAKLAEHLERLVH